MFLNEKLQKYIKINIILHTLSLHSFSLCSFAVDEYKNVHRNAPREENAWIACRTWSSPPTGSPSFLPSAEQDKCGPPRKKKWHGFGLRILPHKRRCRLRWRFERHCRCDVVDSGTYISTDWMGVFKICGSRRSFAFSLFLLTHPLSPLLLSLMVEGSGAQSLGFKWCSRLPSNSRANEWTLWHFERQ